MTGRIINDRYFVLDRIGKGGGGSLYLARDMSLGTLWAVKEIEAGRRTEAQLLTRLSHPCLPKMVDYAQIGNYGYLVMEYIEGHSLEELRKGGKVFSHQEIRDYALTILDILIYLHSRKPPILYGDLKPANLMLSEKGRLYLVDFGSAIRGYGSLTPRNCEGTPGYAAPEQYEGKISPQSDLYGLGKTLAALSRFDKGSRKGLQPHLSLSLPASPGLKLFIRTCTRKDPVGRYRDAASAREALLKIHRYERALTLAAVSALSAIFLLFFGFLLPSDSLSTSIHDSAAGSGRQSVFPEAFTLAMEPLHEHPVKLQKATDNLRRMLGQFKQEDEVSVILLSLAAIAEQEKRPEQSAMYYEQLLLYQPDNRDALSSYGLFLIRIGQAENSLRLLMDHPLPENGKLTRDERLWKERLENDHETKENSVCSPVPRLPASDSAAIAAKS